MDKLIMLQAKAYYLRKVLDKVEHAIELEEARRAANPQPSTGEPTLAPQQPQEPKK